MTHGRIRQDKPRRNPTALQGTAMPVSVSVGERTEQAGETEGEWKSIRSRL